MKVKVLIVLTMICFGYSQISIISPSSLAEKVKKGDATGSNFGEIPYGRTIIGRAYLPTNSDGKNTWCDFEKTSTPEELDRLYQNEYTPIFVVDHSDDCHYTVKAQNVKLRGGSLMLLISDDQTYKEEYNVDDTLGKNIDIPSIIVLKAFGEMLKTQIMDYKSGRVILEIKFTGVKENGEIEIDLFLRSDDVKALHFFHEFEGYFQKLKPKLKFNPIYKYSKFFFEDTNDEIKADGKAPCVKSEKYCSGSNYEMQISNGRVILLENIRQSCVFLSYSIDEYWAYMMNFSQLCADANVPTFTEECSNMVLKLSGLDKSLIDECMKKLIQTTSKIELDYAIFEKRKVWKIPEIRLNGIKYKGTWLSKYIFNAICSGFLDDEQICKAPKVERTDIESGLGYGAIALIILSLFLVMLITVVCYRRIVNKSLEISLNQKIQEQTMQSLEQNYQGFKEGDASSGKKMLIE